MTLTQEEMNLQTIRKVKARQLRGKQIRAKKAAEKAAKQLTPEQIEAIQKNAQIPQPTESAKAEPDYMQLCRAYQKKFECSLPEAMRQIDKIVPLARSAYIKKVNRERDAARRGPRPIQQAAGKSFPEMVAFLKLEHKMTTLQAHKYIDRQWPGLRQAYINSVNE